MGVAELHEAIRGRRLVLLDTMVWIYLLDAHPRYADLAAVVLRGVEEGGNAGIYARALLFCLDNAGFCRHRAGNDGSAPHL